MWFRRHPYTAFFLLAAVAFLATLGGSDVAAKLSIGDQQVLHAICEHIQFVTTQPVAVVFLSMPFLVLGWISASLVKRAGFRAGIVLFAAGQILCIFLYYLGFREAQGYVNRGMWTGAILALTVLPLKSIPMLLLSLIGRWFMMRRHAFDVQ